VFDIQASADGSSAAYSFCTDGFLHRCLCFSGILLRWFVLTRNAGIYVVGLSAFGSPQCRPVGGYLLIVDMLLETHCSVIPTFHSSEDAGLYIFFGLEA